MGLYDAMGKDEAVKTPPPKPTLLIVDDETGPRESLRMVFRDRFHCIVATCGQEGIDYIRKNRIDAAVLDIKMPDMSGVDVLREIKIVDPSVECIMLTGYETLETARAALRYGATDYLNKPFDVFAMRQLIDECMGRRRRRLETEETLKTLKQINEELSRELAQSNRAVAAGVISAGVVHELNNPLSIIAGYAQLLERDLTQLTSHADQSNLQVSERLSAIQHEIDRCKDIARRFLNFSRSRQSADEVVEVARLLDDTAALVRAHPSNRGVEIFQELSTPDLRVRVYPAELIQVLLNIAVNGLQANEGKGQLRLAAGAVDQLPPTLAWEAKDFDRKVSLAKISISDTGCGIGTGDLDKIFQPYFTTKRDGTGLGLAIVCELIASYRGALDVQSEVGKGTTFTVYLPAASATSVEHAP